MDLYNIYSLIRIEETEILKETGSREIYSIALS